MPCEVDAGNWSGEGVFTQTLIGRLKDVAAISAIRVEDAPTTRSEADYNFISNEVFIVFGTTERVEPVKRFGFLPASQRVAVKTMTLPDLEALLTAIPDIGAPDYADEGMLQYLRTERVIPPYQTRGYKLVELVRVYEAGSPARAA